MADYDEIRIIVRTEIEGAMKNFKTVDTAAKKTGENMESAFNRAGNAIKNSLGSVVGTAALIKVLKDSVAAFMESEKASNALHQAFTKTSTKAGELTSKFEAFAKEQQKLTGVEDDAIVKNAAMMQSLTNLSEKGLERGMTAALDLAAGNQMELSAATDLVTKAITNSTEVFRRYSIHMVDGATKAQRLEIVTKALNKQFGGDAAAQMDGYAGKVKLLQNRVKDLQEEIGEGVLQGLFAKRGEDPVGGFLDALEQSGAGIKEIVRVSIAAGAAIAGTIVTIIQSVADMIGTTFAMASNTISSFWDKSLTEISDTNSAMAEESFKNMQAKWKATGALWSNIMTEPEKIVRAERKKTAAQTELLDKETLAKRTAIMNSWRALSLNGMQKELTELKSKYDEEIKAKGIVGKYKKEIDERYAKAQGLIYDKYITDYMKAEVKTELEIENERYKITQDGLKLRLFAIAKNNKLEYDEKAKKLVEYENDKQAVEVQHTLATNEIKTRILNEYLGNEAAIQLIEEDKKYKAALRSAAATSADTLEIEKTHAKNVKKIKDKDILTVNEYLGEERAIALTAENDKYNDAIAIAEKAGKDTIKIREQHAKNVAEINQKMTADEQKAYDAVVKIGGALGSLIPGEAGKAVKGVQDFAQALVESGGDPVKILSASIVALVGVIITELEKVNIARQMQEQNALDNLKNIEAAYLQNRLDNLTVLQNAETAALQKRQTDAMNFFLTSSAAGQAYNKMKADEEAERVAKMDESERAKYEIQKKYDAERLALEEKQKAEQAALEASQKAARNKIKSEQFELEKRIAEDEIFIKTEMAKADVHSKFPMPWDTYTRNNLIGMLNDTKERTIANIKSRVFIPEFASGGRPPVGQMSMVGERGPELFVPDRAGTIVPNNRIQNTVQNMGQTFAITNLNLNGVQDVRGLALQLQTFANSMGKQVFV